MLRPSNDTTNSSVPQSFAKGSITPGSLVTTSQHFDSNISSNIEDSRSRVPHELLVCHRVIEIHPPFE